MSEERRTSNPGKRERQARKRHRRATTWIVSRGAEVGPLKVGRKHSRRLAARFWQSLAVADAEKPGDGKDEPTSSPAPPVAYLFGRPVYIEPTDSFDLLPHGRGSKP